MGKPAILIVDDEVNIRGALTRWFQIRGFEVFSAENGLEAIGMCEINDFDVITMDMEMPRMGGIDALRRIRKTNPGVPVLIVTGFPRDAEQALSLGAAKVLSKPLRLKDLEAEVRNLLPAFEET